MFLIFCMKLQHHKSLKFFCTIVFFFREESYLFLDPRPQPEGSVRPSVRPSFHLPVTLLRISSLVFSETQHGVRGPYIVMCDSRIFWKKSPFGKNDQKWSKMAKNRVFRFFKKIMSLLLSGICVKRKFLWLINILQKLHARKNLVLKLQPKMALGQ